ATGAWNPECVALGEYRPHTLPNHVDGVPKAPRKGLAHNSDPVAHPIVGRSEITADAKPNPSRVKITRRDNPVPRDPPLAWRWRLALDGNRHAHANHRE